ncbi:MAG: Phosphoesterase, DHHA1 [Candidatus Giovannonibacteria bacterium GW2011_GWC2_44_9]|nr:MAG: Phosphoesterase, DHHA1 [Candidatus Giovannonibacteria bacterium GW2011_GWC2_44_9]
MVLYHDGCIDGFGAAWAAWKKFGARAEYFGVERGQSLPNLKDKEVYMLDFCYPLEVTKQLLKIVKLLTIIDHHISVEKSIKLAHKYVYDLKHSGAVLAWKYFHSRKKVPLLLKYVEDVDIWRLKLPYTMELGVSLRTYSQSFGVWHKLAKEWEKSKTRKKYIKEGINMVRYENDLVKHLLKAAERVVFCRKKTLAINAPVYLASQIGDAMRKKGFPLGIIWQKKGDKIVVSLRSTNKVDSAEVASHFGGGGHKKAAAFRLPINQKFPWKKVKK